MYQKTKKQLTFFLSAIYYKIVGIEKMENTPAYKKPILAYINYFRALAIVLIVLGHTIIWGKKDGIIEGFHEYVFAGGTVLFVFIAGFLFEYLAYKFEYKKYMLNKLKNVVMPYFITLLPATIVFSFFLSNTRHYLYQYPPVVRFFEVLLNGYIVQGALWFIPMIIIFYIASPLLLFLKKHKVIWTILILLGLVLTLFSSRNYPCFLFGNEKVVIHSALFCETHGLNDLMSAAKTSGMDLLTWNLNFIKIYFFRFLYFFSVYALGMSTSDYIENNYEKVKRNAKKIVGIGLVLYIAFFIVCVPVLHLAQSRMNIGRFILTYIALAFFILVQDYITQHKLLDKILNVLADYSFGIFFIHMYIFYIINSGTLYKSPWIPELAKLCKDQSTLQAFAHCWYCFFMVMIGSVLILFALNWLLTKIGVKNPRMFIGVGRSSSKQIQNK